MVYTDETRTTELARLHTLRQQMAKDKSQAQGGRANVALADFIAPVGTKPDWVGGFAVTAGHGEAEIAKAFKDKHDDYSAIMASALADRLAEAFAEALHRKVRTELWGYAPDEPFDVEALIDERYRGIRPAPGYPAQPDHTEKGTLFKLLDGEAATGLELTESYAMFPTAAVSGLYFAHPDSHYFGVGRIEKDQSRTMPAVRAGTSGPPNAGWPRSSTTTRCRRRAHQRRFDSNHGNTQKTQKARAPAGSAARAFCVFLRLSVVSDSHASGFHMFIFCS